MPRTETVATLGVDLRADDAGFSRTMANARTAVRRTERALEAAANSQSATRQEVQQLNSTLNSQRRRLRELEAVWRRNQEQIRRIKVLSGELRVGFQRMTRGAIVLGTGLALAIERTAAWTSELVENALAVNTTITGLQRLRYAFRSDGIVSEEATRALQRFDRFLKDVASGSTAAREQLQLLRLTYDDLRNLDRVSALELIAERTPQLSQAELASFTRTAFGRTAGFSTIFGTEGRLSANLEATENLAVVGDAAATAVKDRIGQLFDDFRDDIRARWTNALGIHADTIGDFIERWRIRIGELIGFVSFNFRELATGAGLIAAIFIAGGLAKAIVAVRNAMIALNASIGTVLSSVGGSRFGRFGAMATAITSVISALVGFKIVLDQFQDDDVRREAESILQNANRVVTTIPDIRQIIADQERALSEGQAAIRFGDQDLSRLLFERRQIPLLGIETPSPEELATEQRIRATLEASRRAVAIAEAVLPQLRDLLQAREDFASLRQPAGPTVEETAQQLIDPLQRLLDQNRELIRRERLTQATELQSILAAAGQVPGAITAPRILTPAQILQQADQAVQQGMQVLLQRPLRGPIQENLFQDQERQRRLQEQLDYAYNQANQSTQFFVDNIYTITDAFTTLFTDLLSGIDSAAQAFENFFESIIRFAQQELSDLIGRSFIRNLLGLEALPRHGGGRITARDLYVTNGPELFVSDRSGYMFDRNVTARILSAVAGGSGRPPRANRSGGVPALSFVINALDATGVRRALQEEIPNIVAIAKAETVRDVRRTSPLSNALSTQGYYNDGN